MLKKLMSLLCSLFVPKRAVSGGGATVYGVDASSLGVPDYSSYVQVSVPDSTGPTWVSTGRYVLPYDALIVGVSTNTDSGQEVQPVQLSIVGQPSPTSLYTVRRSSYNAAISIFARKGDEIGYTLGGSGNFLRIFKLTPN